MSTKLTPEQLSLIASHPESPVPMEDMAGDVVCYMVTSQALANLQLLRERIAEADASPDVPAAEAHARIRRMAADSARKHA